MSIKHFKHSQIDKTRWDHTIRDSANALLYAYSYYLDIVSPGWEALIYNDYEVLMPLPVKSKWGVSYLVQPQYTQQLGLFSKNKIDGALVDAFIREIPYFSYELHLNEENSFPNKSLKRRNYLLDLQKDNYQNLYRSFSKNCKRNIGKANANSLQIKENMSIEQFFDFYDATATEYEKLNKALGLQIFTEIAKRETLKIYTVYHNEKPISASVQVFSGDRIINLLPISTVEGKKHSAMFLLINHIIELNAGKDLTLDFEGSMIDGIARFYRGFGAKEHFYPHIKRFRLKFLVGKL